MVDSRSIKWSQLNQFSDSVREGRIKKGYSQRKLASLVDFSHGYIARIERGNAIPRDDDKIRKLAKALDIPESELLETAENDRIAIRDLESIYPASYSLIQKMLAIMTDDTQNRTFDFFERRICLFNEDETKLASNFVSYLLGELSLEDIPSNGLRPLFHYFKPWCPEIEEW